MPNEFFPRRILTLPHPAELPARLVAMLKAEQPSVCPDDPNTAPPEPKLSALRFVHQPADAETVAWNQAREAAWHAEVDAVEQLLRELCPLAFCDQPVPLKIGIDRDLVALLAGETAPETVSHFLRGWSRREAYGDAIRRGGPRYDLDGCVCGEVTAREGGRGGVP